MKLGNKIFKVKIANLQPSQLYISQKKLTAIEKWFSAENLKAIPVIEMSGRLVIADGHTRAVTAILSGWTELPVYYDIDELNLEIYKTCVAWAIENKITNPEDLKNRIISEENYQKLWIERCEKAFGDKNG